MHCYDNRFVWEVINLVDFASASSKNTEAIAKTALAAVTFFIGAYGAYYSRRTYLLAFAIIMVVFVVLGFARSYHTYGSSGFDVVAIVMAVVHHEMLRRSF